jgi:hypothetical protein
MPQFHETFLTAHQTEVLAFQVANSDHASHPQLPGLRMEPQKTCARGSQWADEEPRSEMCPIPACMLQTERSQLLRVQVSEVPVPNIIQQLYHDDYEIHSLHAYQSFQNPEYLIDPRGRQ